MKAFFINPFIQKITTVDYDGDWRKINRMIDAIRGNFDVVRLYENGDAAFVDDEGESIAPKTSFDSLKDDIKFIGDRFELALLHKIYGQIEDYRPYFFEKEKETA